MNLGLIAIRNQKQKSPEDFNIFGAFLCWANAQPVFGAQDWSGLGQNLKFSNSLILCNDTGQLSQNQSPNLVVCFYLFLSIFWHFSAKIAPSYRVGNIIKYLNDAKTQFESF